MEKRVWGPLLLYFNGIPLLSTRIMRRLGCKLFCIKSRLCPNQWIILLKIVLCYKNTNIINLYKNYSLLLLDLAVVINNSM